MTNGTVTNDLSATATASYELDIFGRIRDTVSAARADADSREDLLGQVLLAVQADVAQGGKKAFGNALQRG
jgi:outer membrane protein TolC